jgi:hypothetical protein
MAAFASSSSAPKTAGQGQSHLRPRRCRLSRDVSRVARRMADWHTTPSFLGTAGVFAGSSASISARERLALLGDCDPSDAISVDNTLLL